MARKSGCSPYDLARLGEEYPDVFEEYVSLFVSGGETFRQRRERTRGERVGRLFARMRGKRR